MDIAVHTNIDFNPQPTTPQEETLFLQAGGVEVQLSYRHSGQGPSLIWLPGIGDDSSWRPYHQRFSAHFHLYVLDLPGYGGSTLPEWVNTPRDLAVIVSGFLKALQIQNPTIVGTCLGGWVAAELATLRPERIAKLVLINPLGLVLPEEPSSARGTTNLVSPSRQLLAQAVRDLALANLPSPFPPDLNSPQSFSSILRRPNLSLHSDDLSHRLPLLTTPTLVLWGEDDFSLGPQHVALWTSLLPYAKGSILGSPTSLGNCTAIADAIEAFVAIEHVTEEFL